QPFDRAAGGERARRARGTGAAARMERSEETNQLCRLRSNQFRECGHAGRRQAVTNDAGQFLIGAKWDSRRDVRSELAAVAVGAVAAGAARHKSLLSRFSTLRRRN